MSTVFSTSGQATLAPVTSLAVTPFLAMVEAYRGSRILNTFIGGIVAAGKEPEEDVSLPSPLSH